MQVLNKLQRSVAIYLLLLMPCGLLGSDLETSGRFRTRIDGSGGGGATDRQKNPFLSGTSTREHQKEPRGYRSLATERAGALTKRKNGINASWMHRNREVGLVPR